MKLIGRLPFTWDEVEVDPLLLPNSIILILYALSPFWDVAAWFMDVWRYFLWHLGG